MLDGLDSIKWSELTHAYGPARDVPGQLRELADGNNGAIDAFYGNIWHQGTVYEATAYAVPFLLEILADPGCECPIDILILLKHLAAGNSYLAVHQSMEWYHNERNTSEFQTQVERERDWVRAAHTAVTAGTPVYLSLFQHADPGVRAAVPDVLSVCIERVGEIEPALRRRISEESQPTPRASAVFALGGLWMLSQSAEDADESSERTAFFANLMRDSAQPAVVRFVAGLQTVSRGGVDFINEALTVFRSVADTCADEYAQLPQTDGNTPHGAISSTLAQFPETELQWLFEWLRHPDPERRFEAVLSLQAFCQRWRFAPARVVPVLVESLMDSGKKVRDQVARTIPELGQARFLTVERLEELQTGSNKTVAKLAKQVLTAIRKHKSEYTPEQWNQPPQKKYTVAKAIRLIDEHLNSRGMEHHYEIADAAHCMRLLGSEAAEAVPALQRCLSHESQWVRIRAAQALWAIIGEAQTILPTVLEELRCRPVGLLAAELVGEMHAREAIPILQKIISSETRLVEIGTLDTWIDEDEGFVEVARRALARIEAALGSVK